MTPCKRCLLRLDFLTQPANGFKIVGNKCLFETFIKAWVLGTTAPARPTSTHRGLLALKAQSFHAGHSDLHAAPVPMNEQISLSWRSRASLD
jgi:hypothetical protein